MTAKVAVIGESLVDLVIDSDGRRTAHAGGSTVNVAVGLGRLGHPVSLSTTFADDGDGELLAAHLLQSGVELLRSPSAITSRATARLDADGKASYEFDVGWSLDDAARPPEDMALLHFGSLGAILEPGATWVRAVVDSQPTQVFISYDANCRPSLMPPADLTRTLVEANVAHSRLAKLSDEDAAWLYPDDSLDVVARRWLELGASMVVVTAGSAGATAWTASTSVATPAARVPHLIDTVGAGDAFMTGLLRALLEAGLPDPATLTAVELDAALLVGAAVAGRTCERAGADPPWLDELI